MSNILLVAERAVWAADALLTRAVLFAWTSTPRHHVDFAARPIGSLALNREIDVMDLIPLIFVTTALLAVFLFAAEA